MKKKDLKYEYLSNYNQAIFLRQVPLPQGAGLEYSSVIYHDETYDASKRIVSLRQALFYVTRLAMNDWRFTHDSRLRPRPKLGLCSKRVCRGKCLMTILWLSCIMTSPLSSLFKQYIIAARDSGLSEVLHKWIPVLPIADVVSSR